MENRKENFAPSGQVMQKLEQVDDCCNEFRHSHVCVAYDKEHDRHLRISVKPWKGSAMVALVKEKCRTLHPQSF